MAVPLPGTPRRGKIRLDVRVVERGLAPTREKARALILAGRILVAGMRRDKPGESIAVDDPIELIGSDRPYASRGGSKLAPVLDPLGVDPQGKRCLDLGCSTGGFTDVLLRRGAAHVTAVDVGKGLLDQVLRSDPRVELLEQVNARTLHQRRPDSRYDLVVADLSFISLTVALRDVLALCQPGEAVVLVKPQFELTARDVGRGGVVREPAKRERAVVRVAEFLESLHWSVLGAIASPLPGPKGNREVFLYARNPPADPPAHWRLFVHDAIFRTKDEQEQPRDIEQ
jgi:23S rRNA (cytidine1920-2'-O)/16S rRNA (cytidine1409-2'-O)-methyltransferase